MSQQVLESLSSASQLPPPHRRHHGPGDTLFLSELNATTVVDHLDGDQAPLKLSTFGTVREACPKCQHGQLRLVLRQTAVRTAHLFCPQCESCFDARYASGASALTI